MQRDIGAEFRDLHQRGNPFILANAWDKGSAKMLASLGAKALATSSGAHAFSMGRPDGGTISRDESLAHAQDIVAATRLPVSGDFENGYGDSPEDCAETVRLSAEIGLAGISIEDEDFANSDAYAFELAVERIRAAISAARGLPRDFILVARADGVMNGRYGMNEALRRIRAFDELGPDCLYVPFVPDLDALRAVLACTNRPVNALTVGAVATCSYQELANMGVARISLGSTLARNCYRTIHDIGKSMFENGDFSSLANGLSGAEIGKVMTEQGQN